MKVALERKQKSDVVFMNKIELQRCFSYRCYMKSNEIGTRSQMVSG
jgi:hypothetical protein